MFCNKNWTETKWATLDTVPRGLEEISTGGRVAFRESVLETALKTGAVHHVIALTSAAALCY